MHEPSRVLTIAATGASGAAFTRALLQIVESDERIHTVNFIASDNALRVFAEELDIAGRNNLVQQLLGASQQRFGSRTMTTSAPTWPVGPTLWMR